MQERVVAIIPARGGSKGIPKKNLMDFCGHPLLAWTILQARAAKTVTDVVVSSDDDEILATAAKYGAQPLRRPAELATDTAPSEAALVHALDVLEAQGPPVGLVVFLQATSPLRTPDDIDGAVDALRAGNADSLISVARLEDFFLWAPQPDGSYESLNFDHKNRPRRQDVAPQYLENGSIYLVRPSVLRSTKNRLGGRIGIFPMEFWKFYEVDSLEIKEVAEWYFRRRLLAGQSPPPRLDEIDGIVYDFDGVMTNNRVLTFQDGTEAVEVNRSDGLAVALLARAGARQFILSTEHNPVVAARARKLGVPVLQGLSDKAATLQEIARKEGLRLDRVVYVGNEINDLDAMRLVGWPTVPSDANPAVARIARVHLNAPGGAGVVLALARRLAPHLVLEDVS